MSVFQKLLNVQIQLKAPKSQINKFGGYKYRNCEDILEALKPILAKTNATIFISDEIIEISNRIYVKATVTFVDVESGEQVQNTALAREEDVKKGMDSMQLTGATSSYARKYALNGMFAIDDTKDSDYFEGDETITKQQKSIKKNDKPVKPETINNTITEKQVKFLYVKANEHGYTIEQLKKVVKSSYKLESVKDLNKKQMDSIIERMEKSKQGK